jgi:signal transduction histidine kinase
VEPTTIFELQWKLAAATEALQRSEERATAGQLALEVMHEVRGPLEALGHLTYLASKDANNPEEVRRYMGLADEQLSTLNHIARYTLRLAKSSADAKPVDLVSVAEAALRIHQRTIESKKIHLLKRFPEELPATVHAGEMLQVMSNLIVNALEALPEEGSLYLRLCERKGNVRVIVADDGCGIPKDHLHQVFQPFFTTKGDQGTGLGLSLSKNIVERHRGKIDVRSRTSPGRSGTAFLISIPA